MSLDLPTELTPYFRTSEFEVTSTGLDNRVPTLEVWHALRALCSAVLVPLRERIGPIRITSGYRSPAVNEAIGGSTTSDHPTGRACDLVPIDASRNQAWVTLLGMMRKGLPVDQAILYPHTGHIHVAHVQHRVNRRQVLIEQSDGSLKPYPLDPE